MTMVGGNIVQDVGWLLVAGYMKARHDALAKSNAQPKHQFIWQD